MANAVTCEFGCFHRLACSIKCGAFSIVLVRERRFLFDCSLRLTRECVCFIYAKAATSGRKPGSARGGGPAVSYRVMLAPKTLWRCYMYDVERSKSNRQNPVVHALYLPRN